MKIKYWAFEFVAFICRLIKWFFLAVICITVLGILMPFIKDAGHFDYMRHIFAADKTISQFVHSYIPTDVVGEDISHFIALIVAFILMSIAANYEHSYDYRARIIRVTKNNKKLEKLRKTVQGAKKLAILDEKIQEMQHASRKNREALLQEFVSIKKQLETMGRNLAFLSVDVVDSMGMKKSEDPIVVAHDFAEYRKFAESKLNAYGSIKSAWTPDGIMACFNTVEEAVKTAQAMINGLEEFNRSKKNMKRDFAIRCGVNAGYLLFDDTVPLEEISDRVIDIAGHMRKHAKPNTIFLAKRIVKPIQSPDKFTTISETVDDLDVCEWEPGFSHDLLRKPDEIKKSM